MYSVYDSFIGRDMGEAMSTEWENRLGATAENIRNAAKKRIKLKHRYQITLIEAEQVDEEQLPPIRDYNSEYYAAQKFPNSLLKEWDDVRIKLNPNAKKKEARTMPTRFSKADINGGMKEFVRTIEDAMKASEDGRVYLPLKEAEKLVGLLNGAGDLLEKMA